MQVTQFYSWIAAVIIPIFIGIAAASGLVATRLCGDILVIYLVIAVLLKTLVKYRSLPSMKPGAPYTILREATLNVTQVGFYCALGVVIGVITQIVFHVLHA